MSLLNLLELWRRKKNEKFYSKRNKRCWYETIVIYAESEAEAFEKANYNPDEFEWKRTDDGHDFTIESNVIEATEFPYEEIRDSHGTISYHLVQLLPK